MAANPQSIKQYLHELAEQLPADATTDDALYQLVLHREIEAGLVDSDDGRTRPVEELMQQYGLRA